MVLAEGDLRPWPPADSETSVGLLGRKLAVIAMTEVTGADLAAHPFLHGVSPDHLAMLARAASDVTFPAGHRFFEDGGHAACFWLVQSGHATVDVDVPARAGCRSAPSAWVSWWAGRGCSPVHVGLRRRGRQPGGDLRIRRANGTGMVCR